jgi:hypothetical protein
VTADELVRILNAKGRYPKWRARCPVHKSRGLTLAIRAEDDGTHVYCHAGCSDDDVLAAVGLSWKDLRTKKEWLPPEEFKALQRKKEADELVARERKKHIRTLTAETRKWETVASLLHAHLAYARGKPEEKAIGRLWRKALATARDRHGRLTEVWPAAPEVCGYSLWKCPREITARFVGPEIAEVLGILEEAKEAYRDAVRKYHGEYALAEVLGI